MSALTIDGDLVHYEVLGRGRPVILIHGWIGSWRYWVPTMQQFQSKFRVYALDLFGFGDSSKNPAHFSLEHQLDMLAEFTRELGVPKAAMIGHGLGALVATEFAKRYPDRVPRLVLVSAPLFDPGDLDKRAPAARMVMEKVINKSAPQEYSPEAPTLLSPGSAMRAALAAYAQGGARSATPAKPEAPVPTLRRYDAPVFNPLTTLFSKTPLDALLERCYKRGEVLYDKLHVDVVKTDTRVLLASAETFDAGPMLDTLWLLPMPTLVLHGANDKVIEPPNEDIQRHVTQDKDTLLLPPPLSGTGHFPMLDDQRFPGVVADFLEAPEVSKKDVTEIKERWRRRTR